MAKPKQKRVKIARTAIVREASELTKINENKLISFIDLFESITSILDKMEESASIDKLKKTIRSIIEYARKNQSYNQKNLLKFIKDFVLLMISTDNLEIYIEKIALLSILHPDINKIYVKLKIIDYVAKYFYENREAYSKGNYSEEENKIINNFIFHRYYNQYTEPEDEDVDIKHLATEIKEDKYLYSDYGLHTRIAVITWLYEEYLPDELGLHFLYCFEDDPVINKEFYLSTHL
jgi:hypothetical protein